MNRGSFRVGLEKGLWLEFNQYQGNLSPTWTSLCIFQGEPLQNDDPTVLLERYGFTNNISKQLTYATSL